MSAADLFAEAQAGLDESQLDPDPFRMFRRWFDAVLAVGLAEPHAMTLATATPDGRPSARIVLLRGCDERGFAFFTNYESRKGRELEANPLAALVFYWEPFKRQVRVAGRVERTSPEESDAYFRSRPHGSRISACISPQSEVIPARELLEQRAAELQAVYQGRDVARPPFWGGFRVVPDEFEFWQGRPNRLHDRFRYRRGESGGWRIERLAP